MSAEIIPFPADVNERRRLEALGKRLDALIERHEALAEQLKASSEELLAATKEYTALERGLGIIDPQSPSNSAGARG